MFLQPVHFPWLVQGFSFVGRQNPNRKRFSRQDVTVVVKEGKKIEKYPGRGDIGQGKGERAGVACRMKDGSIISVPEE
jgi:hypothetical protein